MNFKEYLEQNVAYHKTNENGLVGIINKGSITPGQGHYGLAVYLTEQMSKGNGLGDYDVICNVDKSGFDIDADMSDYVRGNPKNVPGFTFMNYDTISRWIVVFDPSRIKVVGFMHAGKKFPATAEGLKSAGVMSSPDPMMARSTLQSREIESELKKRNQEISNKVRQDIENQYKWRREAELRKKKL